MYGEQKPYCIPYVIVVVAGVCEGGPLIATINYTNCLHTIYSLPEFKPAINVFHVELKTMNEVLGFWAPKLHGVTFHAECA